MGMIDRALTFLLGKVLAIPFSRSRPLYCVQIQYNMGKTKEKKFGDFRQFTDGKFLAQPVFLQKANSSNVVFSA